VTLAVAASIVVGAAFLLSGAAKIAAGKAWPVQARELGAPRGVIPVLPWLEIVVGALLCAQVARVVVALVATAMLVAFTVLIIVRLLQGRRPPCACFGSWSAKPLGWRHVLRNGVLIVGALIAAFA
jgi:hypothetical protein